MKYNCRDSRAEEEKLQQKLSEEEFNSVTMSVKPENQNQSHNVRREGIGPQNQKR